jgi:hypothetical protein
MYILRKSFLWHPIPGCLDDYCVLHGRDDQIILSAILLLLGSVYMPGGQHLPLSTDGAMLLVLLHAGPAEFLYY